MKTARMVGAVAVAAALLAGCGTVYTNGKTAADFDADQPVCIAETKARMEADTVARTRAAALPVYRRCMWALGWPTDPVTGITHVTSQPSPGWGAAGALGGA